MVNYADFRLEQYVNTIPVGELAGEPFYIADIILAMEFAKLNGILRGPKSSGKTQLMRDAVNGHFGGEKHALWETGRADFRPKDLFERLNLSVAKGNYSLLPEIKTAYDDGEIKYFVSALPQDRHGTSPGWAEISEQQVQDLLKRYSATTDQLVELKNISKHFFAIDEYNRCPEVIMNLFYGMMTGMHGNTSLGDGYYCGLAAVNPEDYEGTFKMDAAMWARFHIAIDVAAYPITIADKDELNKRNLSPDVHDSEVRDLTQEIFAVYQKIKAMSPTTEERAALQYFQSGLDTCTKTTRSKELIDWPRYCSSIGCEKQTKLCGTVKALDARAIRAVYRLAKGLEEVARLKKGSEDAAVPIVESFSLAYQFVAPFKGIIHPKEVKEARGIEALVLNEKMPAIKKNLSDVLESLNKVITLGWHKKPNGGNLKKEYDQAGQSAVYEQITAEVRSRYTIEKALSPQEIIKDLPEVFEQELKKRVAQMVQSQLPAYERGILDFLQKENQTFYDQVSQLKQGFSKKAYEQMKKQNPGLSNSLEELNDQCGRQFQAAIFGVAGQIFDSSDVRSAAALLQVPPTEVDKAVTEVLAALPGKKISFFPEDKKAQCEAETKKELTKKLAEILSQSMRKEIEESMSGEKSFLRHFYAEALHG